MIEEFLWTERFRPKKIADIILPDKIKEQFEAYVEMGSVPNLLICGSQGMGKTTLAKAVLEELGCDYYVINCSMEAGIDKLRNEIKDFASTMSFVGGRKYIILDEGDYLSASGITPVQAALRNFMEEYSKNCGFILTCNYPEKIILPLQSRFTKIEVKISKSESSKLAQQFLKRVKLILDGEGITYDVKVLAEFIMMHYPDWRKVLNELQGYGAIGRIDSGILAATSDMEITALVGFLKAKSFSEMRKWVVANDIDFITLCRKIYDNAYTLLKPASIPQAVIILADYSYKSAFARDAEINTVAMLTELMASVEFI